MKTKLLIEQHFHGAFGIDFNTASVDDVLFLSKEILKYGIGGIFPTLVTDSVENIKRAVSVIKEASNRQTKDMAKIFGVHLEGIFLNSEKKGIHDDKYFLPPTIENYKLIEDDFIKIVTLAPELCNQYTPRPIGEREEFVNELREFTNSGEGLIQYLHSKNIKVQAGHCVGGDLTGCDGVTHLFNAMSGVVHRGKTTALSALVDDNIYTEIIADGVHVSDDALKLVFKTKPVDKIILISDCLPCTANLGEGCFAFAGEKIYYDGKRAVSKDGTLAGSTTLLPDIIKRLPNILKNIEKFCHSEHRIDLRVSESPKSINVEDFITQLINNPYEYHNLDLAGSVEWDKDWNIVNWRIYEK